MPVPQCSGFESFATTKVAARPRKVQKSRLPGEKTDADTYVCRLQALRKQLHERKKFARRLSWAQFNGGSLQPTDAGQLEAQTRRAGATVLLTQNDFAYGTLRIRAPCTLVLLENVEFEPNADNDFWPTDEQREPGALYESEAYTLGFFAAIAVETENVLIDLSGFTLSQSEAFALQQRFFAVIELADQPFIPPQGPANFGAEIDSAKQLVIENGTLGLSSHHSIHGNGNQLIYLNNLAFRDYEVCSVALNGVKDALITRCVAHGTRENVPVKATYSASRFALLFADRALEVVDSLNDPAVVDAKDELVRAADALRAETQQAFNFVVNGEGSLPALFEPVGPNIDGNAYGFLINPLGVAVNSFLTDREASSNLSQNVQFNNVIIRNTVGSVDEIIVLWDETNKKVVVDTGGAKLDIGNLYDENTGVYVGDALSDVQIALGRLKNLSASTLQTNPLFNVLHIPNAVINWVDNGTDIDGALINNGFTYKRNGDIMFHVNKGVIGLKADGVVNLELNGVQIHNTINNGTQGNFEQLRGEEPADPFYSGADDGGHPAQGVMVGYGGAVSRGVSLAAAENVQFLNVAINKVVSNHGSAYGVDVFNDSAIVDVSNTTIRGVEAALLAGTPAETLQGILAPSAVGFRVDDSSRCVRLKSTVIEEIDSPFICDAQLFATDSSDGIDVQFNQKTSDACLPPIYRRVPGGQKPVHTRKNVCPFFH